MMDPEHYDAGIEERQRYVFEDVILTIGGQNIDLSARHSGKSLAAIQVALVAALLPPAEPEPAARYAIIDELADIWSDAINFEAFNRIVFDSLPKNAADCILMPEANYRLIQEMNRPVYQKVTLEPRQTKPWVHKRDWEGRERRRSRRR